ncbi:TetR/AcrR family transcriptional regulator [Streptomyces sp. NPDC048603]|uniref:TetR/AcrR family transcriptional regulator n=1 Tax=Streptomyces sp. NPDC048603 TaxID=3365577 RepID=UPI003717C4AC
MLTPSSSPQPQRPTAERLLDAAEKLMRTVGLVHTTTKAIAREAGCSEAALYKHYANKEELFVRVLMERTPNAGALLTALAADPAEGRVEEGLAEIATHASLFYADAMTMAASIFAEPSLLSRHREGIRAQGAGPHMVREALVRYLERARTRGTVGPDADVRAAAALLLGACFQRAFFLHAAGEEVVDPVEQFAPAVARAVWAALR